MILSEITSYLETLVPLDFQESYDNCGLLVGEKETNVTGILICLDLTHQVIDEALEKQCNLIISHHPIIFSGLKKLTGQNITQQIVVRAIRKNISLYAMHTNLDNYYEGVNHILCRKLNLSHTKVLKPAEGKLLKLVTYCPVSHTEAVQKALFSAGAGHIWNYDSCSWSTLGEGTFKASEDANPFVGKISQLHKEPELRMETIFPSHLQKVIIQALLKSHPYEEVAYDVYPLLNIHERLGAGMIGILPEPMDSIAFLQKVKEILNLRCIRHTFNAKKIISRVALCGGSGSFLIPDAMRCNADIYLTGDIKYHDFFLDDNQMILADIGHYESEQFTKELIYTLLKKKFTTFALHICETNTNPINYL